MEPFEKQAKVLSWIAAIHFADNHYFLAVDIYFLCGCPLRRATTPPQQARSYAGARYVGRSAVRPIESSSSSACHPDHPLHPGCFRPVLVALSSADRPPTQDVHVVGARPNPVTCSALPNVNATTGTLPIAAIIGCRNIPFLLLKCSHTFPSACDVDNAPPARTILQFHVCGYLLRILLRSAGIKRNGLAASFNGTLLNVFDTIHGYQASASTNIAAG